MKWTFVAVVALGAFACGPNVGQDPGAVDESLSTEPTLREGNTGTAVVKLQTELQAAGYNPGTIDGDFGAHTLAAVEAFQAAQGLVVDGVVGRLTWAALDAAQPVPDAGTSPPDAGTADAGVGGGGPLSGADFYHGDSESDFESSAQTSPFCFLKTSQGTSFTDPAFASRWQFLGNLMASGSLKLRGAYHLLDGSGDGVAQAQYFLGIVGVSGPLPPGTRLVLDWEGEAYCDVQTVADAAGYIQQVTGLWPLIYMDQSHEAAAHAAIPSAPIWEANYDPHPPTYFPFIQTCDQTTCPYDEDIFNGDLASLSAFAGW